MRHSIMYHVIMQDGEWRVITQQVGQPRHEDDEGNAYLQLTAEQ